MPAVLYLTRFEGKRYASTDRILWLPLVGDDWIDAYDAALVRFPGAMIVVLMSDRGSDSSSVAA